MPNTNTKADHFDTVDFIMRWEEEDMPIGEEAAGFQHLVDSGLAWSLQGAYGRRAVQLIRAGLVKDTHHVLH
jgi:hypothetical protein